jgi:cytochrome c biogenesis protein CcdA
MELDYLFVRIMFILSPIIFLVSLIVLIIYEDAEKRKTAKNGMLISLILFVVGFGVCFNLA